MQKGQNSHFTLGWKFSVFSPTWKVRVSQKKITLGWISPRLRVTCLLHFVKKHHRIYINHDQILSYEEFSIFYFRKICIISILNSRYWLLFLKVCFQNNDNHLIKIWWLQMSSENSCTEVLKIYSKFTGEHPNLLHIFRTSFLKNTSKWLLPSVWVGFNITSILVGLSGVLKHAETFIKFLRLYTSQKSIGKWSWGSALKSPIKVILP